MVAPDQRLAVRQPMLNGMPECGAWPHGDVTAFEQLQVGVERDLAERDADVDVRERLELGGKMGEASSDLVRGRFVARRRASNRGRDERVAKSRAVGWIVTG